jgi:hypothetical protein
MHKGTEDVLQERSKYLDPAQTDKLKIYYDRQMLFSEHDQEEEQ